MAEIDRLEINVTANVDDAIAKLNRLASTLRGVNGASQSAAQGQKVLKSNTQHADKATEREAGSIGKLSETLKKITKPLASFASQVGQGLVGALKGAGHAVLGFMRQIVRIAKVRAIRAMLKDLGQSFKDLYGWSNLFGTDYAKSMDKITTATTYLRNSIAAMAAPLVNAIAPVLDFLIDKVVTVLNWFNQLFAVLNGQDTYTVAVKVAKEYGDTLEGSAERAKKSVEDLKRTILGFDEINKLNGNNDNGSGSSTGKSPYSEGYETMFKELPVSSGFKGFSDRLEKALSNTISRIALILAGASFVIGAILAFSGINIPVGIAMMLAGITVGAATLYWDELEKLLQGPIGAATAIVSGALLVLGVLAICLGKPALGLGLLFAGIAGLTAAAVANREAIAEVLKGPIGAATAIVSGALLVLGILAICLGKPMLGLGLMFAGLAGLSFVAIINKGAIAEVLDGPIASAVTLVTAASLVLGVIALCLGKPALGLGLIFAGLSLLTVSAIINPVAIKAQLEGPIGTAIALISGATLMLGVLALLMGKTAIGLGLLFAGLSGLATYGIINKGAISGLLGGPIEAAITLIVGASLMIGIMALCLGKTALGLGLIFAGFSGLAAAGVINPDGVAKVLEGPIGAALTVVSGASLVVGIFALCFGKVALGLGLLFMGIGGLTAAGVLNQNGVAKQLEGPVGAALTIVSAASLVLGIFAICFGKVALGLGLLFTGMSGLAASGILNPNGVKEQLEGPIGAAMTIVSAATLVLGVFALCMGKIALGLGLLFTGISTMAAAGIMNPEAIKEQLQGPIGKAVAIIGAASLLLGAIAMCLGLIPLGLGLMFIGLGEMTAVAVINKNAILAQLEEPLQLAIAVISAASLVLGVFALLLGLVPLGLGLILLGLGGLTATAKENWDNLVQFGKDAIKKVKEGWDSLKEKAFEIAAKIKTKASTLWGKIKAEWLKLKEKTVELLAKIKTTASSLWGKLKAGWIRLQDKNLEFWVKIATTVAELWGDLKQAWEDFKKDPVGFAVKILTLPWTLWNKLKDAWDTYVKDKALEIEIKIKTGVQTIYNWVQGAFHDVGVAIGGLFGSSAEAEEGAYQSEALQVVMGDNATFDSSYQSKIDEMVSAVNGAWEDAKRITSGAWTDILTTTLTGVDNIGKGLDIDLPKIIDKLAACWQAVWDDTAVKWTGIQGTVMQSLTNLTTGFELKLPPFETMMHDCWSNIESDTKTIWGNIERAVKDYLKNIKSAMQMPHFYVNWATADMGWLGSFSYPRSLGVNWYARGGILDGAQIFGRMGDMLLGGGEAGREAVLPLEQNTGWMDTLADRIYDNNVQRAQADGTNQSGAELAVMNAMLTEMRSMLNELRGINEKEFSTQITTADINRAQTRANRRAGVTVAPVGGA